MRPVVSHVDLRVRDRAAAKQFYSALFEPLGITCRHDGDEWTSFSDASRKSGTWLGFTTDPNPVPGSARVAFLAASREEVDRIGSILASIGARAIEMPHEAYGPEYYACFFEDPDGNKLEVCYVED